MQHDFPRLHTISNDPGDNGTVLIRNPETFSQRSICQEVPLNVLEARVEVDSTDTIILVHLRRALGGKEYRAGEIVWHLEKRGRQLRDEDSDDEDPLSDFRRMLSGGRRR